MIEIWEDEDEEAGGYTCSTVTRCAEMRARGIIEPTAKLIHSFEATTWLDAMNAYYTFMGFGKYNPNDENGVVDPVLLELLDEREDLK